MGDPDTSKLDAFVKSWILDTLRRTLPNVEDLNSKVAPADIVELFQQICQSGGLPPQLDMSHLTPRTCRSTQAAAVERAVYETLNTVYPASARSSVDSHEAGKTPCEVEVIAADAACPAASRGNGNCGGGTGETPEGVNPRASPTLASPDAKRPQEFAATRSMSSPEASSPSTATCAPKRRITVRTISGGLSKTEEASSPATGVPQSS